MYGMFGMTVFMFVISAMLVQFRTFHVGVTASVVLLVILVLLKISQYTYTTSVMGVTLTSVGLFFTLLIGYFLIKSVRREVRLRHEVEHLAGSLEKANARLKILDKQKSEFLSIASHQLRSPLTAIRGYTSLMLEGSYGPVSEKLRQPIDRIHESSRLMALAVEDYLNVSRIESGNMKYSMSDFSLVDQVDHLCDDLRPEAIRHGLSLLFRTDVMSRGIVHADLGKTVQIVQNLINNAIKYTKQGSIRVLVRDDLATERIYVDIVDTGIGMDEEALSRIFQKFERAKNANAANVHGTGLGLYVALKMAKDMNGNITAHSDGEGKGSRFTIELPLAL
jgi:signal transduction histidine kinase